MTALGIESGTQDDKGELGEAPAQEVGSLAECLDAVSLVQEGGASSAGGVGGEVGAEGLVEAKKPVEKVSEEEVRRLEEAAEKNGGVYDEVEIEDLEWSESDSTFYYPCPCGDKFQITLDELIDGEDIALCPSCSLRLRVVYDEEALEAIAEKHGIE